MKNSQSLNRFQEIEFSSKLQLFRFGDMDPDSLFDLSWKPNVQQKKIKFTQAHSSIFKRTQEEELIWVRAVLEKRLQFH